MNRLIAFFVLLMMGGVAAAATLEADLLALQQAWDKANFGTQGKAKEKGLEALAGRAHQLTESYPGRAEPLVWEAIVLSSWGGAKGGLGALSLVEKARDLLLEAEKIDPAALKGSVYTSLGSLYYQVPGWPVGFGDDKKARQYLEKAVAINPNGMDPNYFYGDFLLQEGRYKQAIEALKRAQAAPPRPDRPLADQGRGEEIRIALETAQEKEKSRGFGW